MSANITQSPMNEYSGCRKVAGRFFSKKWPTQAKSVTAEQRGQQEHRLPAQDRRNDQQQHPAAADEVQPARDRWRCSLR
jgi:hypothetical protein